MSSGSLRLLGQNPRLIVHSLLITAVLLAYGNSFKAGWHFDDVDHITFNKAVQLNDISSDSIIDALYAAPRQYEYETKKAFRPLASLTFALNWYLGKDNVVGYHAFNLLVHVASACLLFELILSLYGTPRLRHRCDGATAIAFSTAILWALNPIQTQAVTYIVQRMTSMAALFFIIGMLLYVRGRLSNSRFSRLVCFTGVGTAYALAMASKENSVVLPAALVLVEAVFFAQNGYSKPLKVTLILGAFAIGLGTWWIVFNKAGVSSVLGGYALRPYTMFERLITQPRVLLFYLSLIFLPIPQRLSIQHDITHSVSLIDPWTTLASAIIVCAALAGAMGYSRKRPIFCFAILFFFLTHSVESTIVPLELVFEHRNYLPSVFLFWPVSVLMFKVYEFCKARSSAASSGMLVLFALIIMGMGIGTYERNFAWADGFALWGDAVAKSQKYDRPYIQLAQLYDANGDFDSALGMYALANEKISERKSDYQFVIFNNTGNIFFKLGDYDKAIEIWSYAANNVKDNSIIRRNLAIASARKNEWQEAIDQLDLAIVRSPRQADLHFLKAQYLSEIGQYGEALSALDLAVAHGYDKKAAQSAAAIVFYHMKEYEKAGQILKANYSDSMTIEVMIWLLAIDLQTHDVDGIARSRNDIARIATEKDLTKWLEVVQEPDHHLSKDRRLISELKSILNGMGPKG